jgi:hypothetical protein
VASTPRSYGNGRTENAIFRVTAEEKARIAADADAEGLRPSDYMRFKVLGPEATPQGQSELLARVAALEAQVQRHFR